MSPKPKLYYNEQTLERKIKGSPNKWTSPKGGKFIYSSRHTVESRKDV